MITADMPPSLHWEQCTIPVSYYALQSGDKKLVKKALKKVHRITGIRFTRTKDKAKGINFDYYLVTSGGTLAVTSVQYSGSIIWSGVRFYNPYLGWYDKRQVVHHELHHALGINHNNRYSSLMYPYSHGQWYDKKDTRKLQRKYRQCH